MSNNLYEQVLKPEGHYVFLNGGIGKWLKMLTGLQNSHSHLFLTNHSRTDLELIARMVDSPENGRLPLQPVVAASFPLNDATLKEGFDLLKSRRTIGKIVFEIS